jgi:hypothetical protein
MAWLQQRALEYTTSYLTGGDAELAVYRDSSRPTFVAQEFREMTASMPELATHMPNTRQYLLGFPNLKMPSTRRSCTGRKRSSASSR